MGRLTKQAIAERFDRANALFSKFVKPEQTFNPGRDIRFFNCMIKDHTYEFWNKLDLGFKLNSLAFFLTKEGKEKVKELKERAEINDRINKNRAGIKLVQENKFICENSTDYGVMKKDDGPNYELDNFSENVEDTEVENKIMQTKNKRMVDFLN